MDAQLQSRSENGSVSSTTISDLPFELVEMIAHCIKDGKELYNWLKANNRSPNFGELIRVADLGNACRVKFVDLWPTLMIRNGLNSHGCILVSKVSRFYRNVKFDGIMPIRSIARCSFSKGCVVAINLIDVPLRNMTQSLINALASSHISHITLVNNTLAADDARDLVAALSNSTAFRLQSNCY
jgi:hypothetical protein